MVVVRAVLDPGAAVATSAGPDRGGAGVLLAVVTAEWAGVASLVSHLLRLARTVFFFHPRCPRSSGNCW